IGGDVIARSVYKAELPVDFDAARRLTRYACPNVVSEFVHSGIDKVAAERNAEIRGLARAPPIPERIARCTRNRGVAAQTSGAMGETRPDDDVSAPFAGYWQIDDGIQRE